MAWGLRPAITFRAVPESWDEGAIREIASLGHEIGYHYENLSAFNGNSEKAFDDFKFYLSALRDLVAVKTICMHGSPRSRIDNLDLWKRYGYRDLGIIGEPYLDVDFNHVFYLTDTGRRWDGWKVSVRDKLPQQADWIHQGLVFHATADIIRAAKAGNLPEKIIPVKYALLRLRLFHGTSVHRSPATLDEPPASLAQRTHLAEHQKHRQKGNRPPQMNNPPHFLLPISAQGHFRQSTHFLRSSNPLPLLYRFRPKATFGKCYRFRP